MSKDTVFYEDIYNDFYITYGGLFSKKTAEPFSDLELKDSERKKWEVVKHFVLKAVNTHDEVDERQPQLIALFNDLKLGRDLEPLKRDGDILLRDFIVEVKQPSFLKLSSNSSSSSEANDQQLLRAMHSRGKKWGILTNAGEWQFVYSDGVAHSDIFIPYISFSVLDMIRDEEIAVPQIKFFLSILLSRETRSFLVKSSADHRNLRTMGFAKGLQKVTQTASDLGYSEDGKNELVKFIFRLSFLFYCEDIGILPRSERKYVPFDLRKQFQRKGKWDYQDIKKCFEAFASQSWSEKKISNSGNSEFWTDKIDKWIKKNILLLQQVGLQKLWFTEEMTELDMSDISSGDLCDVYQNCVEHGSENVGTVYTTRGLSNFINHIVSQNIKDPLRDGQIILDPACGSGHLLKRVLFVADRLVAPSKKFRNRQELVEHLCVHHLAGLDKNETAVFITKLNLWLSCATRGKSLPVLGKFREENTLKRFESAFSKKENQLSEFLGDLGSEVRLLISNPPWSMIANDHPEKWISNSEYWKSVRQKTSKQDNTAFNFGYLSSEIINKNGLAILILPGSFFIGSTIRLRDHLLPNMICYAPVTRNVEFETVDSSQNYGIVAFTKKPQNADLRVYFGLNSEKITSTLLPQRIAYWPKNRKLDLDNSEAIFETDTLLPLFYTQDDIDLFLSIDDSTSVSTLWDKGSRGKPIKGEKIKEHKIDIASPDYYACPENRGNSKKIVDLVAISKNIFDKCNEHVLRLDLSTSSQARKKEVMGFIESAEFNRTLSMLRTTKSIRAATLNLMGMPDKEKKALREKTENLLVAVKKKRKSKKVA